MNRADSKRIALNISNSEIFDMFCRAKKEITDWSVTSICNKGMTKGVAWNILASNFDINKEYHNLAKTNMVREFGEFLTGYSKPTKKEKTKIVPVHHQPNFDNYG